MDNSTQGCDQGKEPGSSATTARHPIVTIDKAQRALRAILGDLQQLLIRLEANGDSSIVEDFKTMFERHMETITSAVQVAQVIWGRK